MEVILHRSFKKKFKKLPPKTRDQFFERADLFLHDKFHPLLNNHSVERVFLDSRSINITGDYRAIFREDEDGETVIFTKICTHSELYG